MTTVLSFLSVIFMVSGKNGDARRTWNAGTARKEGTILLLTCWLVFSKRDPLISQNMLKN